ncbi:MAG: VTT domain-containing protein [Candidatus Micrarchaeota archaeon]|nr:VTT domain-containing protein [Candidatus Micrarchaeota archaeon]
MLENLAASFGSWAQGIIESLGYLGVFVVSFIGSASVLFPLPSFVVVFSAGAFLNPVLVGIISGIGAGLGEATGYGVGAAGAKAIERYRKDKLFRVAEEWFQRHRGFWIIFIFAATPLPDDIIGILCGIMKYPFRRFVLASVLGKITLGLFLAFGGHTINGLIL